MEFNEYQNAILSYGLNFNDIGIVLITAIGFLCGCIIAQGFGSQIFKI
jgi:hypothetical protein